MTGRHPAGERAFVEQLLAEVRSVMKTALQYAVPPSGVDWTEMRWDTVDITATWSPGNSHRNIHGWVGGDWPIFSLRFEGSAWEDDENNLRRRVVFLAGPDTVLRVREGGTAHPKIDVPDREQLVKDVGGLVERLQRAELKDLPWEYGLAPRPDQPLIPQG